MILSLAIRRAESVEAVPPGTRLIDACRWASATGITEFQLWEKSAVAKRSQLGNVFEEARREYNGHGHEKNKAANYVPPLVYPLLASRNILHRYSAAGVNRDRLGRINTTDGATIVSLISMTCSVSVPRGHSIS